MRRLILAVALLCSVGSQTALGQDSNRYVQVQAVEQTDSAVIRATNQSTAPVAITLRATLENMRSNQKLPLSLTLKPGSTTDLATFEPDDRANRWRYNFKYYSNFGDPAAEHDDDHVYLLPFEPRRKYTVIQGYGGAFSHQGEESLSLDFNLAVGDKVLAARAGTVIDSEAGHANGGADIKHKNHANYVLVLHKDGTIGRYLHLKKDGVKVKIGQKVAAGNLLGLSGQSGYCSCPHLHFDVFSPLDGEKSQRVKTKFKTTAAKPKMLEEGKAYTRPK